MAKQSFAEMASITTAYHNECSEIIDVKVIPPRPVQKSPVTQKYFDRVLMMAAKLKEKWAV